MMKPEPQSTSIVQADLIVCQECDALVSMPYEALNEGNSMSCPRCAGHLIKHYRNRLLPSLFISLSGLFLFFPANFLPVMSLSVLGNSGQNTMVKGVYQLAVDGYWWMAFLVLFCSVLVPGLKFLLVFIISLKAYFKIWGRPLIHALKLYQKIEVWGMLDVYLIAILLSYIKMTDMGDLILDVGLFCFIVFLLLDVLVTTRFEPGAIWRQIDIEGKGWSQLNRM